jgi:hypothetical protein
VIAATAATHGLLPRQIDAVRVVTALNNDEEGKDRPGRLNIKANIRQSAFGLFWAMPVVL